LKVNTDLKVTGSVSSIVLEIRASIYQEFIRMLNHNIFYQDQADCYFVHEWEKLQMLKTSNSP